MKLFQLLRARAGYLIGLLAALGAVTLTACGTDPATTPTATTTPTDAVTPSGRPDGPSEQDVLDLVNNATGESATLEQLTVSVAFASFEVLTGTPQRLAFGLFSADRTPLGEVETTAWIVRDRDGVVAVDDTEPLYYGSDLGAYAVHVLEGTIAEAGLHWLYVRTPEGHGIAPLNATDPAAAIVPVPGSPFPSVTTATADDMLGLDKLCTRQPACPMHEHELTASLASEQITVLSIASPAFCSSTICGPTIDVLTALRDEVDRDDVDWIHGEVYTDAGNTPAPYVSELALPTEPWTWIIRADGTVHDRFDGPLVPDLFRSSLAKV